MKERTLKTKLLTVLLALCMVLSLVPMVTLAAPSAASDTADFTVQGGTTAIDLLNQYRTGTGISSWDNSSKTLTLRGIDFTTTAQTAVKLPAGSTVVLADGSVNAIRSGDVSIDASGTNKNQTFISALDAAGSLTIQGGLAGTGSLEILAGNVNNSGNSWTYSSGITVDGDLTVKGGHVTTRGGSVESQDICFSIGVNMDSDTRNKALLVTGGTLTAIAGEAYELQEDGTKIEEFSRGVYMYRGSVSVSGSGKLTARSVPAMVEGGLLSNGLYISVGDLLVAGAGEVEASGAYGVYISGGGIRLDGGKLTAASTQPADAYGTLGSAVDVDAASGAVTSNAGNITVNGGTLETVNGKIYMSSYGTAETQGLFTVTGGAVVNEGTLYGAKKLMISGGTVQTQRVSAKELSLSGSSLTIREPVRKNPYSGNLYALPAVDVRALAVSGGTLDVAWDWGEYTPIVLPKDEEYNDVGILVRMSYDTDTASFTGGTSTLDTGFAGNTALLLQGQLTLGDGMAETGADASHRQAGSDPVKFAAAVVTPDVPGATAPSITTQPDNATIKVGETATFTIAASGTDLSYQWMINRNDGNGWVNIANANAASYTTSKVDKSCNGFQYKCVVSNSAGNIESNSATLTVQDAGGTDTEISIISIEKATLYYDAGDKPKATTEKFEIEGVISNYEIEYECWEEMETTESGESVPIKFWYSDESQYTSSQQKITTFEVGKTYMYSISVKAEDGYSFADDYELYVNSVAQQSVIKTQNRLLITAITTIQPRSTQLQNISVVEINNATISFNVGDKPVFTGKTPDNAPYIYQCEWWETDEGKEGKHSTDFFDGGFERLITNFERGKTYNYGIYLKAAEGYCFTTDTKLKINGKYYDYDTNDYDPLLQYDNDGFATMWVHTDLTMTPTAAGETPNYKIIEGANGTWTQNRDGTLVFRANGDFDKFTGIKIDGTLIDVKNYTAKSGSTVITLKTDYLKTLSVGTHKLTVVYTDGECSTNFEVKQAASEQTKPTEGDKSDTTTPTGGKDTTSPQTGDNSNMLLWVALLFVSVAGVLGTTVYSKKKRVR